VRPHHVIQNIKERKRVLSNHYATGSAKLFCTPIISAVETGIQSQLLLKVETDTSHMTFKNIE
jgi:hypothetical protein